MKRIFLPLFLLAFAAPAGAELVGLWTFSGANPLAATVGADALEGSGKSPVATSATTNALYAVTDPAVLGVRTGVLAAPTGSGILVPVPEGLSDTWCLVFDFFPPGEAPWHSLFTLDPDNATDGSFFLKDGNKIGRKNYDNVGSAVGSWHRVVVSMDKGAGTVWFDGNKLWSQRSWNLAGLRHVLFAMDDNGSDELLCFDEVRFYDEARPPELFPVGEAFSADAGPLPIPDPDRPAPARCVVLVGIDGLGSRQIPWERMPNLSALRDGGLHATARCGFPTSSAINWASVFFGTTVELHGFRTWGSSKPDVPAWGVPPGESPPDLFRTIREEKPGAWTASVYTWDGVAFCHSPKHASFSRLVRPADGGDYPRADAEAAATAARLLEDKPDFLFLYQGQVDSAGHRVGWKTPAYTNACENVDANIGTLLAALDGNGLRDRTTVLVLADHGGAGRDHGGASLDCFEVPFVLSGPGVAGMRLREPVILADAAPTILSLLGLDVPETMRGRPAAVPND